ncbi:MAG: hypothetical protein AAFV93_11235 [Chloroflexota bacterium]
MNNVIVQNALINTGIGDIHLVSPSEAFEPLYVRSLLGSITILTPLEHRVRISVEGGRFFGVTVNDDRYEEIEAGVYLSRDANDDYPLIDIVVTGTFGDTYLS